MPKMQEAGDEAEQAGSLYQDPEEHRGLSMHGMRLSGASEGEFVSGNEGNGMRPPDLPSASDLGAGKSHGTRIRYMSGCKCLQCRAANSSYECERAAARKAGQWNGLVPARKAQRHIKRLSKAGIGRRSISDACSVGLTTIMQIKSGEKTQIRKATESAILQVDKNAISGGTIIPANRAWKMIDRLLNEGFSKAELARRLGFSSPAIQFRKDRITGRSAMRIERFYNRIMAI